MTREEKRIFFNEIKEIISHKEVQKMQGYRQHGGTTTYAHSLNVALYSYILSKKFILLYYNIYFAPELWAADRNIQKQSSAIGIFFRLVRRFYVLDKGIDQHGVPPCGYRTWLDNIAHKNLFISNSNDTSATCVLPANMPAKWPGASGPGCTSLDKKFLKI